MLAPEDMNELVGNDAQPLVALGARRNRTWNAATRSRSTARSGSLPISAKTYLPSSPRMPSAVDALQLTATCFSM